MERSDFIVKSAQEYSDYEYEKVGSADDDYEEMLSEEQKTYETIIEEAIDEIRNNYSCESPQKTFFRIKSKNKTYTYIFSCCSEGVYLFAIYFPTIDKYLSLVTNTVREDAMSELIEYISTKK